MSLEVTQANQEGVEKFRKRIKDLRDSIENHESEALAVFEGEHGSKYRAITVVAEQLGNFLKEKEALSRFVESCESDLGVVSEEDLQNRIDEAEGFVNELDVKRENIVNIVEYLKNDPDFSNAIENGSGVLIEDDGDEWKVSVIPSVSTPIASDEKKDKEAAVDTSLKTNSISTDTKLDSDTSSSATKTSSDKSVKDSRQDKRRPLHDKHVLDRLSYQISADDSYEFLLADKPEGEKKPKKRLSDLANDIRGVFKNERIPRELADSFFADGGTFDVQSKEIKNLLDFINSEKDKKRLFEYSQKVNEAYIQIRNDALALVMTTRADRESRRKERENSSEPQRSYEEIRNDIDAARYAFDGIVENNSANPDFKTSKEYLDVVEAFKLADGVSESDKNVKSLLLAKYLKNIWQLINKLPNAKTSKVDVMDVDLNEILPLADGESLSTSDLPDWFATDSVEGMNEETDKLDKVSDAIEWAPIPTVPPSPEPDLVFEKDISLDARKELGQGRLEQKQEMRTKEEAYLKAVDEYYSVTGLEALKRMGKEKLAGLVGIKPELPESLQALEREYKEAKKLYATSLQSALINRSGRREGTDLYNDNYLPEGDGFKGLFARNFIIKPTERMLEAQESSVLTPELIAKRDKVLGFMAKHKWTARVGIVTAAGIAGGLTGGAALALSAASWQTWKMVASTGAGLGAAKLAKIATDGRVEKARLVEAAGADKAKNNFNLDDIDTLATEYAKSQQVVKRAESFQKKAVLGAGIAAGGLTGYGLGQVPEDYIRLTSEAINTEVMPAFDLTNSGMDGNFTHHIGAVNFGANFDASALTPEQMNEVTSFVRERANLLLDAHHNMSEARLEQEVFGLLERRFGEESWWRNANLERVDIDGLASTRMPNVATVAAAAAESGPSTSTLSPNGPVAEVASTNVYDVVKDDTLSKIMLDKFKLQFSGFDAAEKQELMARVFADLKSNPELIKQLGLRSGDINLIYPGEKINMSLLQDLIDQEGERAAVLENFQKSAPLSVEAETGVKNIPITVTEKPIIIGSEVNFEGRTYTEAAPTTASAIPEKPSVPTAPKISPLNGQYLEHPAYEKYLAQVFGSDYKAEIAIDTAVKSFDANAYDAIDKYMNAYDNPYLLMREQSLADFDKLNKGGMNAIKAHLESFKPNDNFKYEAYIAWMDKINELRKNPNFPTSPNTKIGDLIGRAVVYDAANKTNLFIPKR